MWTTESTLELIDDLRSVRCLWDVTDSDYKSKHRRYDAISELAKKYYVSVAALERKLHTLKGQFQREHKKFRVARKNGASPRSAWFGYKPLMFLSTVGRITDAEENKEVKSEGDITKTVVDLIQAESSSSETDDCNMGIPTLNTRPKNAKKTDDVTKEALQSMKSVCEAVKGQDGVSVYAEFVADSLRNCKRPQREIFIAQHHINDIIFQLQMGGFASQNQNFSFPTSF